MSIKSVLCMATALMTFDGAAAQETAEGGAGASRVLVVYFSCTGTTRRAAEAVAETLGATLYRITPAKPYTSADLNWHDDRSRSSVEMKDPSARPALGGEKIDASAYDTVLLGFPIWWDEAPRAVNTFIESQSLQGVRVIPFATSGGSSIDGSVKALRATYPKLNWQKGRLLNGGAKAAASWARTLGL